MDNEGTEVSTNDDISEQSEESELGRDLTGKRQKVKFTSIVNTSEILSEEEIRSERYHIEKITLVQVKPNDISSEWKILGDVCQDMLACLQWMARRRLIANSLLCTKCDQNCSFQLRRDRTDKYNWTCKYPCNFKKSIREASFFAGSHLSLPTILQLINLWALKTKQDEVQARLRIKQRHTIVDWYGFIREICARKVLDKPHHIGGVHEDTLEGIVVTFGVFDFAYSKDKEEDTFWVVLGIESGTDRCFVVPVDSYDPKSIVTVLRQYIEPGTILLVLCRPLEWDADGSTATIPEDFATFAHDYSITLDFNPDFSSAAYDVEETELWKLIQRRYKSKSDLFKEEPTSASLFQSYIQEAIWRKMHSDNHFSNIIADIGVYYPV